MQRPGSKRTNAQAQENEQIPGAERTASWLERECLVIGSGKRMMEKSKTKEESWNQSLKGLGGLICIISHRERKTIRVSNKGSSGFFVENGLEKIRQELERNGFIQSYLGDRIYRNWGLFSCGVEGTEGKKLKLKFPFGARLFSEWSSHASKIRKPCTHTNK